MLRNKFYTTLLLSFITSLLLPHKSQAERIYGQIEPPRFKLGRFAVKFEMDSFKARNNFGKNGKKSSLTGDFEASNAYLGVENDLSSLTSVSTGLLLGRARSSVNQENRQSTDIKGLQFGLSRMLLKARRGKGKSFDVIGDVKFFQSLNSNSFGSDDVSVGDGTSWVQVGTWFGTDSFKYFRLWLYGGVNWPFKGLSKNFVFLARPEFKFAGGRLGLGIEGQIPIIKDKDEDDPTNRLRLFDEYNGGSFYYQGLNSEFIAANFWFGFEPAPLTEFKIGLGNNLLGSSSHRGLRVFLALEVSFSVTRTGYSFPYVRLERKGSKIQKNNGVKRLKNYAKPKKK